MVRHYKLTFTAVGPIHIGTGRKLNKLDYFSSKDGIAVLDVPRFLEKLSAAQVEEYCEFLETADSSTGLQTLLDSDPAMRKAAEGSVAYRADAKLTMARRGTYQYLDVAECIKGVDGRPYVPGSSVKGMLRTALLTHLIAADRKTYLGLLDEYAVKKGDKSACEKIESRAFEREHPDRDDTSVVNDIMRYISVSDSEPLKASDIVFAKKYDKFCKADDGRHKLNMGKISQDPGYYEGSELNLYREALKPGTLIVVNVDIDSRVDAYFPGLKLDKEGLSKVLGESFELYSKCFLNQFDTGEGAGGGKGGSSAAGDGRCQYVTSLGMRCRNEAIGGTCYCRLHKDGGGSGGAGASGGAKACICYLGGGVDFDSKTVINALYADNIYKRVGLISETLYAQFPTKLDPSLHRELQRDVLDAGFTPITMRAQYKSGRVSKGKDDHRHWRDPEFKVSPHTLKLGKVGAKKYPMGKCTVKIEERQ